MKLLGRSWKYIDEGNAHIVIQLTGTSFVLRLIKVGEKAHTDQIIESVNFVNLVMVPLSENCRGTGEIVEIPGCSLSDLRNELQMHRPKHRLNKSVLSPYAIKVENLAIVSPNCKINHCIEIKPKEGFIASRLKTHSKCYYCLKQNLKLQNNDVHEASAYCPLDLFSGDKNRMRMSLHNLMRNPQNNYKLFRNGILQNCEKSFNDINEKEQKPNIFEKPDLLVDFIIEILLSEKNIPNDTVKELITYEGITSKSAMDPCNDHNQLKPNNLLYKLLQLQKLSDTATINEADVIEQQYEYVSKLLNQLSSMNMDLNIPEDRDTFLKTANPLHLAVIAAIAKDCSIMISLTTDHVENMPYIDVIYLNNEKTRFYYKLALTDLEPKPMTTLLKRKCTERKTIDIYEKYLQSMRN